MKRFSLLTCAATMGLAVSALADGPYPELLWDMEAISKMTGGAALTLHQPEFREVVMVYDAPWEGNDCCYHTVFHDGRKYCMYYRGGAFHMPGRPDHESTCYAESDDGIHWRRPKLGIWEFDGSKENNIVWMGDEASHNFAPCYDSNPACPPEQRYKAVAGLGKGLCLFYSPDGIHWTKAQPEPILTNGAFDSLNTIFYDGIHNRYVANSRFFQQMENGMVVRAIQRHLSQDAVHWADPEPLDYGPDAPYIELYTNGIHPYVNNPTVYIGLPKRFISNRVSIHDMTDAGGLPGLSDGGFMSSRDGIHFKRWDEAFVRPGLQHERWINRNNMSAQGVVLTKADLEGTPPVLTIFSTEAYDGPEPDRLRRLTLRLDGFVSVKAPYGGGTFTMKPMTIVASQEDIDGQEVNANFTNAKGKVMLLLNASTSALGEIRCEIRDEQNNPIPGYSLEDSVPVFGDELDLPMMWKNGAEIRPLVGRTVILHFEMKDADVYSLRFGQPRSWKN